jgi:mutator protein MutT
MTVSRPPFLVERGRGYLEYQLPVSVKLVIDCYGRVPLLRNERREWELPGGKLEVGETPETGVCREVREELGLSIDHVEIIDSWVYEITPTRHVFIVSYGAVYRGDEEPRHSAEHNALRLFDYSDIEELVMPSPYKRTIRRWHARTAASVS